MYNLNDAADFLYTPESNPRVIHVVGTVVKRSDNVKKETPVITVRLDDPSVNKGREFISCKLSRINLLDEVMSKYLENV
jgi:hypothetical protein